jgi:hypothetical protein
LARLPQAREFGDLLAESVLIGGWVARWRPIEFFLYDWWPSLAEARLYDRFAYDARPHAVRAPAGV